jgi:hypothetical protein
MKQETVRKNSQLIAALREAVGVVQMILFKEVRSNLENKLTGVARDDLPLLAGAITNEVFGTPNPREKFVAFRKKNWGIIEQELLTLRDDLPFLCRHITDALRTQVLCDNQEGDDSSETLVRARKYGILMEEREVPLHSTFMTLIRELGKQHNLIIPPVQISPEQDDSMVH